MKKTIKFPETKSSQLVKNTGMYVCQIVEEIIKNMIEVSPCGQLMFDGLTCNGVHTHGLFMSFMTSFKVVWNGIENTF